MSPEPGGAPERVLPEDTPARGPGLTAAALVYVAMAVAATWPLVQVASTHCWGARYDLWANLWLIHYFYHAFTEGPLTLFTKDTFYPEGFSVWAYGHFLLQILVCPILAVARAPVAHALLVWSALAGSALAMYALALDRVKCRWAALVAGALYSFHGLAYAEMAVGSLEQAATFGLPLYALFLIRWVERGGWRWGVLAYLALMLSALSNWFFGIALATFTALYTLFHLLRRTSDGRLRLDGSLVAKVLVLGLACGASAAPFVARVVPQTLQRPPLHSTPLGVNQPMDPEEGDSEPGDAMDPLLSRVDEARSHRIAFRQTVTDSFSLQGLLNEGLAGRPWGAGPGFQMFLLAGLALFVGPRAVRFWLFAFASLTVISMGPFFRFDDLGAITSFRLPYHDLYNSVPLFRVAYRPYRFGSVALLAAGVLAAFTMAGVLARVPEPRRRAAVAIGLMATMLFVRWVLCSPDRGPLLSDARIPAFYEELAREPGRSALIEIPLHHWAFGDSNARFQYYQTLHERPTLNNSNFINLGQLLRLRALARAHPLLFTIVEGPLQRAVVPPPTLEEDLDWLRRVGFGRIVVHTSFPKDSHHLTGYEEDKEMVGEAFVDFLEALFGPPRVVDGALLFDVGQEGNRDWRKPPLELAFPGDYTRTWAPVTLEGVPALRWPLPGIQARRLVFWAMATPGSKGVRVRLESRDGSLATHDVPLDEARWKRVVVDVSRLGELSSVSLVPGLEKKTRLYLARVQLAR